MGKQGKAGEPAKDATVPLSAHFVGAAKREHLVVRRGESPSSSLPPSLPTSVHLRSDFVKSCLNAGKEGTKGKKEKGGGGTLQ